MIVVVRQPGVLRWRGRPRALYRYAAAAGARAAARRQRRCIRVACACPPCTPRTRRWRVGTARARARLCTQQAHDVQYTAAARRRARRHATMPAASRRPPCCCTQHKDSARYRYTRQCFTGATARQEEAAFRTAPQRRRRKRHVVPFQPSSPTRAFTPFTRPAYSLQSPYATPSRVSTPAVLTVPQHTGAVEEVEPSG